jgi:hypothetical protein
MFTKICYKVNLRKSEKTEIDLSLSFAHNTLKQEINKQKIQAKFSNKILHKTLINST